MSMQPSPDKQSFNARQDADVTIKMSQLVALVDAVNTIRRHEVGAKNARVEAAVILSRIMHNATIDK